MAAPKKSGKLHMVGHLSRPVPTAADPLDQLVYGSAASASASPLPSPVAAPAPTPNRRIVFTNQLTPSTYTQLRQYEYWGRLAIHEILDAALTAYFADKPEASQPLPEKERAKLRGKLLD
jgi:hypothetical protein